MLPLEDAAELGRIGQEDNAGGSHIAQAGSPVIQPFPTLRLSLSQKMKGKN